MSGIERKAFCPLVDLCFIVSSVVGWDDNRRIMLSYNWCARAREASSSGASSSHVQMVVQSVIPAGWTDRLGTVTGAACKLQPGRVVVSAAEASSPMFISWARVQFSNFILFFFFLYSLPLSFKHSTFVWGVRRGGRCSSSTTLHSSMPP